MVLHKRACNGSLSHRRQYLAPICDVFGEKFEDLDHYNREDAFARCLNKLTLEDVRAAIRRAETITSLNEQDGKTLVQHKGYSYYRDNPALSIHKVVKTILDECGVLLFTPRRSFIPSIGAQITGSCWGMGRMGFYS
jgi:hypothetical protein